MTCLEGAETNITKLGIVTAQIVGCVLAFAIGAFFMVGDVITYIIMASAQYDDRFNAPLYGAAIGYFAHIMIAFCLVGVPIGVEGELESKCRVPDLVIDGTIYTYRTHRHKEHRCMMKINEERQQIRFAILGIFTTVFVNFASFCVLLGIIVGDYLGSLWSVGLCIRGTLLCMDMFLMLRFHNSAARVDQLHQKYILELQPIEIIVQSPSAEMEAENTDQSEPEQVEKVKEITG